MGNTELLPCLKEHELEFTLRSNRTKIPVGPQYIQQKGMKVGTKYAMSILQIKDKGACLEQYTYESKALDNDLFEAEARVIPFVKGSYSEALSLNKTAQKLENCLSEERVEEVSFMDDLGINEDNLRAIIRIEFATKQQKRKVGSKKTKSISDCYKSKMIAIKKARKIVAEKTKQEKLAKRTALAEEKERTEKLKALRAKLELEIELETQD